MLPMVAVQKVETTRVVTPAIAEQAVTTIVGEGEPLKAPMPGTILEIKVTEGDRVKKGDVLFILEAMKMENEITATNDGVVTQILVTKGTLVATNDVLARIQ